MFSSDILESNAQKSCELSRKQNQDAWLKMQWCRWGNPTETSFNFWWELVHICTDSWFVFGSLQSIYKDNLLLATWCHHCSPQLQISSSKAQSISLQILATLFHYDVSKKLNGWVWLECGYSGVSYVWLYIDLDYTINKLYYLWDCKLFGAETIIHCMFLQWIAQWDNALEAYRHYSRTNNTKTPTQSITTWPFNLYIVPILTHIYSQFVCLWSGQGG